MNKVFLLVIFGLLIIAPVHSALYEKTQAYYKLDSLNSNVIIDELNNYNGWGNGTLVNGEYLVNSVNLTNSQLVYFSYNNYLTQNSSFAISFWIKGVYKAPTYVIDKRNDYQLGQGICCLFNEDALVCVSQSSSNAETAVRIPWGLIGNNNWHHIVYQYNGSYYLIYLDGVLIQSIAGGIYRSQPTQLTLGARYNKIVYTGMGTIDEFAIFSEYLEDVEILELYNDGEGLSYPFVSDIDAPQWVNFPTNLSIFRNESLNVVFNATDESEIDNYWLSNFNEFFSINKSGYLTNKTSPLYVGNYSIIINVNDTNNNTNSSVWGLEVKCETMGTNETCECLSDNYVINQTYELVNETYGEINFLKKIWLCYLKQYKSIEEYQNYCEDWKPYNPFKPSAIKEMQEAEMNITAHLLNETFSELEPTNSTTDFNDLLDECYNYDYISLLNATDYFYINLFLMNTKMAIDEVYCWGKFFIMTIASVKI